MRKTFSAMRSHGDQPGINGMCKVDDASLLITIIVDIRGDVAQCVFFYEVIQAFPGNAIGHEIRGRIDIYYVEGGTEKFLQRLDFGYQVGMVLLRSEERREGQ